MNVWFTSDLHADHFNIIQYCSRPFADVNEQRRTLTANWNDKVGPRDRVYVLGDFVMGGVSYAERLLKSLNGEKYLIKGNHDRGSIEKLVAAGFAWVGAELRYQLGPYLVILSHYPYAVPLSLVGDPLYVDKFASRRPKDKGNYLLHGHVHTAWKKRGRQVNVGVDRWNYAPASQDEIVALIKDGGTDADAVGPKYEE